MAEGKKSFIIYTDLIHTVEELEEAEAGRLFKHILRYVNDLSPECDRITKIAFEPIKQQLKRDLKSWEESVEQKSMNGRIGNLKRWSKELYDSYINGNITIEEAENIAKYRKTSQPDSAVSHPIANIAVNVNDNVTVNVNDNKENNIEAVNSEKKSLKDRMFEFYESLKPFVEEFSKETVREFYDYWTEHSPNGKKMRFEKETVFDRKKRLQTWQRNEKRKFEKLVKPGKKEQTISVVESAAASLMDKFDNEGK